MGTFLGHLVPGLALTLLGLWHAIHTIKAYLVKPSSKSEFTVKFWYPFNVSKFMIKYLELLLLLSFSIFAIFLQVLDFPSFHLAFKLDNFEHAAMFIHLAVFSGFTLSAELIHSYETLSGVAGILLASVFGQELFLLHFHSTDHVGLEGHYHWLLQLMVFVSLVAALAATYFPNSFPAAFVLSISVLFQGCWFINMGFMLWVPAFVPKECVMNLGQEASRNGMIGAVPCAHIDADVRARALANLQFSWILAAILTLAGSICLGLASKHNTMDRLTEYERLCSRVGGSKVIENGPSRL